MNSAEEPKRYEPSTGKSQSMIFLLHGYGADATDLISLAPALSAHLPGCAFVAFNAPETCVVNPMGRQWFPIPSMDGSDESAMLPSLTRSVDWLAGMIEKELRRATLTPSSALIFGFSQGAMVALHYSLAHDEPYAGIIACSGQLLEPESLKERVVSRPPVLLVHGDADSVVPFTRLQEAAEALSGEGFSVETHTSPGVEHGIAPDGLAAMVKFAQGKLPLAG